MDSYQIMTEAYRRMGPRKFLCAILLSIFLSVTLVGCLEHVELTLKKEVQSDGTIEKIPLIPPPPPEVDVITDDTEIEMQVVHEDKSVTKEKKSAKNKVCISIEKYRELTEKKP